MDEEAPTKRLKCPKCEAEGRPPCTRFHMIEIAGTRYIRCERKDICGWRARLDDDDS